MSVYIYTCRALWENSENTEQASLSKENLINKYCSLNHFLVAKTSTRQMESE